MPEYRELPISKIFVEPDRVRKLDMDFVYALNAEITAGQFVDPILVRKTPRRKKSPYTLIDGEHRLEAEKLDGQETIACIVVEADADEAEMLEAGANLFRHLSMLDRAISIHRYRQAWERKHGKIKRGGDQSANFALCSEGLSIDAVASEASAGFSVTCAERMGMSKRSVETAVYIASRLPDALIEKLRGTTIAENQTQLTALAKLENKKSKAAVELFDDAGGQFDELMRLLNIAEPKPDEKLQAYSRIIGNWDRTNHKQKWNALEHIGVLALLTDAQKKKVEKLFGGQQPKDGSDLT